MKACRKPPNWTSELPPLAALGLLVCTGAVVYGVVQTAAALARGTYVAASTAGGLTTFFAGFLGALAVTRFVSAANHADWSSVGTTVRVHPAIAWWYGVALLGAVVGSALYLWSAWRGARDLPFAGDGRVSRYLMTVLLVLAVTGLVALLRSREPGYLRVGVDGVEHGDMFRTRTVRWEDIVDVTDRSVKRSRNPIVFAVRGGKPIVVANADRYGSSGTALYWMVRHYWRHPDDRDELIDARALERLRGDRFAPG